MIRTIYATSYLGVKIWSKRFNSRLGDVKVQWESVKGQWGGIEEQWGGLLTGNEEALKGDKEALKYDQCHMHNRMMPKPKLNIYIKLRLFSPNLCIKYQILQQCKKPEIKSKIKDFECAIEDEIKKPFLGSSSKSCDLISIPTRVLKNFLDILITPITDKINISIETSTFPQTFTDAHIRPPV